LVNAADSLHSTRELTAREGIFAGISSGAVIHVAQRISQELDGGDIVCLLPDGGWKYLSTHAWAEDLATAEQYLRRSLAIAEMRAPGTLEVAWRLNNLGIVALLMVGHLAGTFLVLVTQPQEAFQHGNPLMLSMTGEFVVKNVVLITAGLLLATRPREREPRHARRRGDEVALTFDDGPGPYTRLVLDKLRKHGSRVEVTWEFEERLRAVEVKVLHAPPGEKKEADKEARGGKSVGILVSKGDKFIELRGDGEEKARKYHARWLAERKDFDPEVLKTFGKLTVGSRLLLEWVSTNHGPQVHRVEVLKAAPNKDESK